MFKRKVCHERQIRALLDIFLLKTIIGNSDAGNNILPGKIFISTCVFPFDKVSILARLAARLVSLYGQN